MVRIKNRYLLCQIRFKDDILAEGINGKLLAAAIKFNIQDLFGDYGARISSTLQVKYYSPYTGLAIIKTGREHSRLVWNAITFITMLKSTPCVITVVHVSGTIKKLQQYAVIFNQKQIDILKSSGKIKGMISVIQLIHF
ncbi:hypothetical protein BC833DRAFT_578042 [Globomyces pollinis-pini]|nr:hypothetical protein BC833DRAFT_578042 [Globomyces pollinis-pini]